MKSNHGAITMLLLGLYCDASAAQVRVPQDFATIQGAIDAAESSVEIIVSVGTYNEPLLVDGKHVRLIGSPSATVAAPSQPRGVALWIVNAGSVTLQRMTLTGEQSAIWAFQGSSVSAEECSLIGTWRGGDGIRAWDAERISVTSSTLRGGPGPYGGHSPENPNIGFSGGGGGCGALVDSTASFEFSDSSFVAGDGGRWSMGPFSVG